LLLPQPAPSSEHYGIPATRVYATPSSLLRLRFNTGYNSGGGRGDLLPRLGQHSWPNPLALWAEATVSPSSGTEDRLQTHREQ